MTTALHAVATATMAVPDTTGIPWLTLLIIWPVVGALILWALPGGSTATGATGATGLRRRSREIALGISVIELAIGVGALIDFDTSAAGLQQFTQTVGWIPQFGVSYAVGVNGVGLALILMSLLLVPLVILAAWKEQGSGAEPTNRLRHYLALVLLLTAFMVAVFAARDVFFFYVVFEAMLIPVYFMIGAFGGSQRRYAAVKFLLFSLAGGLIMLIGVIALYLQGPRGEQGFLIDNLTNIDLATGTGRWLFLAFFIAFAVKAPMFPVHSWLPDAAEQAPAGTSTLLVGVLDKVGTFGMLTLCLPLFPEASRWAAPAIIVLALISIFYGALLAIGQQNMFRLVAYTSVSHFGFIVLGIFAFTSTSVAGSSFYMVNHGLSTGALFLLVGFLVARRGSARIEDFGGLQRVTPVLAGTFLVVGLSALSLPGLSTFISEFLVIVGTFASSRPAAIVAALAVVLAAIYILWTYQRVFTGPVRDELADTKDLGARERWVVGPLIALMLVFGFYPAPALTLVDDPAETTITHVGVQDAPDTAAAAVGDEGSDQ